MLKQAVPRGLVVRIRRSHGPGSIPGVGRDSLVFASNFYLTTFNSENYGPYKLFFRGIMH